MLRQSKVTQLCKQDIRSLLSKIDSGGGTRTPGTRIIILMLYFQKANFTEGLLTFEMLAPL